LHLDLSTLEPAQVYATMTQTIVPRPIAWVLSENDDGGFNLAPFSYFNAISSAPPMVMLSIGVKPSGEVKDTRYNIEQRKAFVVHIAHRELAPAVTASSATLARGVSELDTLGLDLVPMPGSALPRLKDCRVAYACRLSEIKVIGHQAIVFAELEHLYLDDAVCGKDAKGRLRVLADKVDAIGRLGGSEYITAGDIISIDRPA